MFVTKELRFWGHCMDTGAVTLGKDSRQGLQGLRGLKMEGMVVGLTLHFDEHGHDDLEYYTSNLSIGHLQESQSVLCLIPANVC